MHVLAGTNVATTTEYSMQASKLIAHSVCYTQYILILERRMYKKGDGVRKQDSNQKNQKRKDGKGLVLGPIIVLLHHGTESIQATACVHYYICISYVTAVRYVAAINHEARGRAAPEGE